MSERLRPRWGCVAMLVSAGVGVFAALAWAVAYLENSRRHIAELDLCGLQQAMQVFQKRHGHFPATHDGLEFWFARTSWGGPRWIRGMSNTSTVLMEECRSSSRSGRIDPEEELARMQIFR